ncbi:DUF4262 domain-containing protein [Actinopolyspora mortivallis]|uniref:DUF4262 domain-containing protein n=1 Tax=Actinopolyspora mortivallis TaxID=33906 RepID=UPI00036FDD6E|nr:DUF4262 domain-containing protein [Actinopolyspora mortivallis]
MTVTPDAPDQMRDRLLRTAERHGAAVVHVDEEEQHPPYAFSAGVWRRFGKPEVVVIGLPPEVAHAVVNTYTARAARGERFVPGRLYEGFLAEQPVTFERVCGAHYPQYLGSAVLLHDGDDFPALQMVLPEPRTGLLPWSEGASEEFREYQPVLTDSGLPESWTPGVDGA